MILHLLIAMLAGWLQQHRYSKALNDLSYACTSPTMCIEYVSHQ